MAPLLASRPLLSLGTRQRPFAGNMGFLPAALSKGYSVPRLSQQGKGERSEHRCRSAHREPVCFLITEPHGCGARLTERHSGSTAGTLSTLANLSLSKKGALTPSQKASHCTSHQSPFATFCPVIWA